MIRGRQRRPEYPTIERRQRLLPSPTSPPRTIFAIGGWAWALAKMLGDQAVRLLALEERTIVSFLVHFRVLLTNRSLPTPVHVVRSRACETALCDLLPLPGLRFRHPRRRGLETCGRLRRRAGRPRLTIVFASGLSSAVVMNSETTGSGGADTNRIPYPVCLPLPATLFSPPGRGRGWLPSGTCLARS
jgi:hypothetical protein